MTGLVDCRNRAIHAQCGAFTTRDRFEYVDSLNLYEYVQTMPTTLTDPFGDFPILIGPPAGGSFPDCEDDLLVCRQAAQDQFDVCKKHEPYLKCRLLYLRDIARCKMRYQKCKEEEWQRELDRIEWQARLAECDKSWYCRVNRWISPYICWSMH